MTITKYIIYSVMLALVWAGCSAPEEKTVVELPAIPVTVKKVSTQTAESYMTASGQLEAVQSANVSTRMMGHVNDLKVKTGDAVKKGQLLLTINSADLLAKKAQVEASIMQAQAGFNNAKKDYERFEALFAQESASQKELDDMTARYEMAKAGLEAAEQMKQEVMAQFAYTNIRAPFDGLVTNTFIKEGMMANPGMPLVTVEAPDLLEASVMVPETDIEAVSQGMEVEVLVKSLQASVMGTVTEVSRSAKNTGGQYMVKVSIAEAGEAMLPGMFVNAKFPMATSNNQSIKVPKSALVQQGQLTGIYTVGNDDVAILRWLRTGNEEGSEVEILAGLKAQEQYIASAEGRLFNGAKIKY